MVERNFFFSAELNVTVGLCFGGGGGRAEVLPAPVEEERNRQPTTPRRMPKQYLSKGREAGALSMTDLDGFLWS